jgi:hypothetical protein
LIAIERWVKVGVKGRVMEEVEWKKIKYTYRWHTLRHPFEYQLTY